MRTAVPVFGVAWLSPLLQLPPTNGDSFRRGWFHHTQSWRGEKTLRQCALRRDKSLIKKKSYAGQAGGFTFSPWISWDIYQFNYTFHYVLQGSPWVSRDK